MEPIAALELVAEPAALRRQLDIWLEQAFEPFWAPLIWPALIRLCARLQEALPEAGWQDAKAELCRHDMFLLAGEDPFTRQRRDAPGPRGGECWGQAALVDLALRHPAAMQAVAATSTAGRDIHAVTAALPVMAAWHDQKPMLARMVEAAVERDKGAAILTLDAGHLREAALVAPDRLPARWQALETDPAAQPVLRGQREQIRPLRSRLSTTVSYLRRPEAFGRFDVIHAAASLARLAEKEARALADQAFGQLKPGGVLLLGSPPAGLAEAAYLDAFLDWRPRGRDESEMAALLAGLPKDAVLRRDVFTPPGGGAIYAMAVKRL